MIGRRSSESTKLELYDGYTLHSAIVSLTLLLLIVVAIVELSYVGPVLVLSLCTIRAHDSRSFFNWF